MQMLLNIYQKTTKQPSRVPNKSSDVDLFGHLLGNDHIKKPELSLVISSWKNLFSTNAASVIPVLVDTYKTFDYFQPQKR